MIDQPGKTRGKAELGEKKALKRHYGVQMIPENNSPRFEGYSMSAGYSILKEIRAVIRVDSLYKNKVTVIFLTLAFIRPN